MTAAISLAEVPKPSDRESEVLYVIDARQKLGEAIEDQKRKREAAESGFASTFAKEIRLSQVVDGEVALQKNEAFKAADLRAKQRIEALASILEKVNKRIEQLKADFPEAVNSALTKRVETLEKALLEKEAAEKGLEEQIKKLKAEISKLPKAAAKKAGSSY